MNILHSGLYLDQIGLTINGTYFVISSQKYLSNQEFELAAFSGAICGLMMYSPLFFQPQ